MHGPYRLYITRSMDLVSECCESILHVTKTILNLHIVLFTRPCSFVRGSLGSPRDKGKVLTMNFNYGVKVAMLACEVCSTTEESVVYIISTGC